MNNSTLAVQLNQIQKNIGDPYLRLQLDRDTGAVLPMDHTQEVLVVPLSGITFMPNMPSCVLGLLNHRSRVLWVVDLPQMLDFQAIDPDLQQYNIAIVQVGKVPLGLVVHKIKGVVRFTAEAMQSPIGTVSPGLTPYLRACVPQEKEVLLVLDAEAIVNSSVLHQ